MSSPQPVRSFNLKCAEQLATELCALEAKAEPPEETGTKPDKAEPLDGSPLPQLSLQLLGHLLFIWFGCSPAKT